jgi:hypothetical protein
MAAFAITTASDGVQVRAGDTARVPFTVTNTSGRSLHARGRVVAEDAGNTSWFAVADGEGESVPGLTRQFTVQVAVPAAAPSGSHRFRLDVIGVESPDDLFGQGPWSSIQVQAVPQPRRFPWWILAVLAGAVALTALAWTVTHRAAQPAPAPRAAGVGRIAVSPPSLDFSPAAGSTASAAVTVTDSGTANVTIRGVQLQSAVQNYRVVSSQCGAGTVLRPGASCQVVVQFSTAGLGYFQVVRGSLVVSSDAGAGPVTVALQGGISAAGHS